MEDLEGFPVSKINTDTTFFGVYYENSKFHIFENFSDNIHNKMRVYQLFKKSKILVFNGIHLCVGNLNAVYIESFF